MEVSNGSVAMLDKLLGNEALARVTRSPVLDDGGTCNKGVPPTSLDFCTLNLPLLYSTFAPHSDGVSPLSQLNESVEATSVHVDRVLDRGKNVLSEGKASHGGGFSLKKRCRSSLNVASGADDIVVPEEGLPVQKTGCTVTRRRAVNGEKVEKMPSRKSRGQGSKRSEKKGCQQSVLTSSDQPYSKDRLTNSQSRICTTGILDLYRFKAKPVDLARHVIDVTLDQLLLGTHNSSEVCNRDFGGSEGNLERLITKVLNFFSKSCATPPLCSSGTDSRIALNLEGQSSNLTLDLERSLQPEEKIPVNVKISKELSTKDISLNKESEINISLNAENNSLIRDISGKFSVDNLPDYPIEDFLSRLKLPSIGSLDLLVSNSKLEGAAEVAESLRKSSPSSIPGHSLPPLPHSVPLFGPVKMQADYDWNGKSQKLFERQWFRGGTNEINAKGFQALLKEAAETERECMEIFNVIENPSWKNVNGRLATKTVAREQVSLEAQRSVHHSIHTVSNLQSELSHPKVDSSDDCRSGKPSLYLESNKESESFEFKRKASFNVVQDLLPFKPFCGDDSDKSQIQARLSDMQFEVSKPDNQDQMQSVKECALKQASLLAVRSPNFESVQINCSPGFPSPNQSSSYFPVSPYSPGAEDAAQILCSMANFKPCSLERGQIDKGKKKTQRPFQPSSVGFIKKASKIARIDSNLDRSSVSLHSKSEEIFIKTAADDSTTSKKFSTFEKRKSISQVNQVIAAVERTSSSPSSLHAVETSNLPGGCVLLLAAQTGNPVIRSDRELHTKEVWRNSNGEHCSVASKSLSRTDQYGKSSKDSFPLKVRTFTGGPPKQKRVMPTNFPKVSLVSCGSKVLAESSRSSQKSAPRSLNSFLGSEANKSFSVPVNTWRKNHSMEKLDTKLRQDTWFDKSSGE